MASTTLPVAIAYISDDRLLRRNGRRAAVILYAPLDGQPEVDKQRAFVNGPFAVIWVAHLIAAFEYTPRNPEATVLQRHEDAMRRQYGYDARRGIIEPGCLL